MIDLRVAIANTSDSDERAKLISELKATRKAIANFEEPKAEEAPRPEPEITASEPEAPEPNVPAPEPKVLAPEPEVLAPEPAPERESDLGHHKPVREQRRPRRRWLVAAVAGAALVGIAAGVGWAAVGWMIDPDSDALATETFDPGDDAAPPGGRGDGAGAGQDPETAALAESSGTADGPGPEIRVSVYDYQFAAQGVLPSEAAAILLDETTLGLFGERADITIDTERSPAVWLAASRELLGGLSLLAEGEIIVTDESTVVSGTATAQDLKTIVEKLEAANFPPVVTYVDLVDSAAASLRITVREGRVGLSGILPDDDLRERVVADLTERFGDGQVSDSVLIDESLTAGYSLARFGTDAASFEPFGDFDAGIVDNEFFVVLAQDSVFDVDERTMSAESQTRISNVAPVLLPLTGPISIRAYTDNQGTHDENHAKSLAWAQTITALFVDSGVAPGRLSAEGLADANPLADNDTEFGRARNRRVEIWLDLAG